MPDAARIGDLHTCPVVTPAGPHVGGPVLPPGAPTVIIGGQPAARVGDLAVCAGLPDAIVAGEPSVLIGGQPAARKGDPTAHGGVIAIGTPTVQIGPVAGAPAGAQESHGLSGASHQHGLAKQGAASSGGAPVGAPSAPPGVHTGIDAGRPDPRGTLMGRVTESGGTSRGLPGVTVVLDDQITTVTDLSGDYLFRGLAAGSYTARVECPGFVLPVPVSATVAITAGGTTRQNFKLARVALEIVDPAGGRFATSQTCAVGQLIALEVRATPSVPLIDIQWTVPGTVVSDYVQRSTEAAVRELEPAARRAASLRFHWLEAPAISYVRVRATAAGATLSAELAFDVLTPTDVEFTARQLAPRVRWLSEPPPACMRLALIGAHVGEPGIQWSARATAPPSFAADFAIVQVCKLGADSRPAAGGRERHVETPQGFVLDASLGIQYAGAIMHVVPNWRAPLVGNPFNDSPSFALPFDSLEVSASDEFRTYFMYRPEGADAIWVTLAVLAWRWQATATRTTSTDSWRLGDHHPTAPQRLTAVPSRELPLWQDAVGRYRDWR